MPKKLRMKALKKINAYKDTGPDVPRKNVNIKIDPDTVGSRFGSWTVLGISEKLNYRCKRMIDARCDCGTVKPVMLSDLKFGSTKSCKECHMKRLSQFINDNKDEHGRIKKGSSIKLKEADNDYSSMDTYQR
jgi:hypothetical protein